MTDWYVEEDCQPNVYEMFARHGGPGFWVRRTTWDGTCARVVCVGAITGPPPYFGSPSVLMDVYSLDGRLREEAAQLPCPGTFKTWRQIAPPEWATPDKLRILGVEDAKLAEALAKLDRKRHKTGAKPAWRIDDPTPQARAGLRPAELEAERIKLAVPYERRDEAKGIGARWDPSQRT